MLDAILILLPMVPGLGHEVNGATSWIRIGSLTFQPSELAKPVTILAIGAATAQYQGSIVRGADFLKLLGILLIPFVLLMREDLGTASSFSSSASASCSLAVWHDGGSSSRSPRP